MAGSSAPKDETSEPSGGWWDSWLSSAKSKSAEVYSMVKKDLDEIGTAVKSEASHVYNATSNVLEKTLKLNEPESTASSMKKSFSTFLDQVNTVLNPEPDDEDTEVILSTGDTTMLSTYKKELEALQRLDATFLVPADSPELDAWRLSLEGDTTDGVISPSAAVRRLRTDKLLAMQYEKLVPSAVSEQLFWERYLFRVALLQDRLALAVRMARDGTGAELPPTADPVLAHLPLQIQLAAEENAQTLEGVDKPLSSESSPMSSPSKSVSKTASPSKTVSESLSPSKTVSKSPSISMELSRSEEVDEGVVWDDEDFASDVELTEEQQIILLQEYEKEIANKKQLKNSGAKEQASNDIQAEKTSKQLGKQNKEENIMAKPTELKASSDSSRNENDVIRDSKKNLLSKNSTTVNKYIGSCKSDVCDENLVEDHFKVDERKVKDDASSNSDESWEKEFEIDEPAA